MENDKDMSFTSSYSDGAKSLGMSSVNSVDLRNNINYAEMFASDVANNIEEAKAEDEFTPMRPQEADESFEENEFDADEEDQDCNVDEDVDLDVSTKMMSTHDLTKKTKSQID